MKSKDSFTSCLKFSDKFLHMMYGFSAFVFLGFYTQWSFLIVLGWVMLGGLILEVLQIKFADGFSYRDLVADLVGALLAIIWVTNPKNLLVFAVLLGLYLWWEGIPRLRGQR